jgi:hypothetical protein
VNPEDDTIMLKAIRILKYIFIFIVLFTGTGCASVKKNRIHPKRKEALCDLSHLGKNKYFYSAHYQRKLAKSFRKNAR